MFLRYEQNNLTFCQCELCGKDIKRGILTEICLPYKKSYPEGSYFTFLTCFDCEKDNQEKFERILK